MPKCLPGRVSRFCGLPNGANPGCVAASGQKLFKFFLANTFHIFSFAFFSRLLQVRKFQSSRNLLPDTDQLAQNSRQVKKLLFLLITSLLSHCREPLVLRAARLENHVLPAKANIVVVYSDSLATAQNLIDSQQGGRGGIEKKERRKERERMMNTR